MIHFERVSKIYPGQNAALRELTLKIEPKEFVSIVGQSGSGKTTLAKLIIAEERPTSGRIVIGGWDITRIPSRDVPLLRRQIGVIFQDYKLLQGKTVFENVAFALEVSGASRGKIEKVVPDILRIVGLRQKADKFPQYLSGGEQQRVVIARALVHRPKLIVADEPTGNLDTVNTMEIIDLLKKINEFGTTVLLVTHNREVVNALQRRVITLDKGRVVSDQEKGRYLLS